MVRSWVKVGIKVMNAVLVKQPLKYHFRVLPLLRGENTFQRGERGSVFGPVSQHFTAVFDYLGPLLTYNGPFAYIVASLSFNTKHNTGNLAATPVWSETC